MAINWQGKWVVRGVTAAIWALAAGSLVYWGLRLLGGSSRSAAPPTVAAQIQPPADAAALARVLGAAPQAAAASAPAAGSRLALMGVVAGTSTLGAALIGVDGKAPRPYRVGAQVDEGLVVQSVEPRQVKLGLALDAPTTLTLDMPARK